MKAKIGPGVLCYVVRARNATAWIGAIVEVVRLVKSSDDILILNPERTDPIWWVRASDPLLVPRYNRITKQEVTPKLDREAAFYENCLRPITGLPEDTMEEAQDLMELILATKGHDV